MMAVISNDVVELHIDYDDSYVSWSDEALVIRFAVADLQKFLGVDPASAKNEVVEQIRQDLGLATGEK